MDNQTLRTHWALVKQFYRSYQNNDVKKTQANKKLLSLLAEMLAQNTELAKNDESKEEELQTKKQWLDLANAIYKQPALWCKSHPEYV